MNIGALQSVLYDFELIFLILLLFCALFWKNLLVLFFNDQFLSLAVRFWSLSWVLRIFLSLIPLTIVCISRIFNWLYHLFFISAYFCFIISYFCYGYHTCINLS